MSETTPRRGKHRVSARGKFRTTKNNSYRKGGTRGKTPHKRTYGSHRRIPTFDPTQFINKNPSKPSVDTYVAQHTFADFGLDKNLLGTLTQMGLKTPTSIQDQIIPKIMQGHDVVGLAETGTGKTAAFLIPLLQKTVRDNRQRTLILAPTRELAIQINDELRKLTKNLKIFSTVCVGGTSIRPQLSALKRTNHFIIGTPGRILDHVERRTIRLSEINNAVLDEADRMLDMGFVHDMRKILSAMPKDRQTLFFSATMDEGAKKLVNEFLSKPEIISVKKQDIASCIAQDIVTFNYNDKFDVLTKLFSDSSLERVIIFGEMKHSVQKLADQLVSHGIRSEAIHGNKSHAQRQRALKAFKDGRVRALVATDVAARGIHVDNVSHVINYDLPQTFEDYTHRIGRTGRGNQFGQALTFVQMKR